MFGDFNSRTEIEATIGASMTRGKVDKLIKAIRIIDTPFQNSRIKIEFH
jgi:hypothetical protein